ncbi:putative lipid-transfer protein DIR1 [Momordica charantia]|uniref:Lipid-transfer protein DIR1 n=1 Tax=Momordica charantia TaxID=3673 RepID=A0A6J1CC99_MOMCH|nr:putative lipid-transfer protein DIR1 [Momordica charantia]
MDRGHKVVAMALVLIVALGWGEAQTLCNMSIVGLYACRPSVTPPNPTPPSANCCTALSHADLHCFCAYRNSGALPSLGIDPNLALKLPEKCKLPNSPNC